MDLEYIHVYQVVCLYNFPFSNRIVLLNIPNWQYDNDSNITCHQQPMHSYRVKVMICSRVPICHWFTIQSMDMMDHTSCGICVLSCITPLPYMSYNLRNNLIWDKNNHCVLSTTYSRSSTCPLEHHSLMVIFIITWRLLRIHILTTVA